MSALVDDALLLDEQLNLSLGHRTIPEPNHGQLLVRLEWAGVCGSDLHVLRTGDWVSQWPATLGHEAVGVVELCPGNEIAEGTRVVIDSRMPCGECSGCRRAPNQCDAMRWVGEGMPGGFQRRAVFDVKQVVACPDSLESAIAVLAEPLAVAMHAVNRGGVVPERVLILGYGPVGALMHAEVVRRRPDVAVTVMEPHEPRQQMARAAGATLISDCLDDRWPWVIDAAGHANALADALDCAETGGTVVLVALAHGPVTVAPQVITERALSIVGSNGFNDELPLAIAALNANPDHYRWLITESVMLDEAPARLSDLTRMPSAGKVVIAL